MARLWFVALAWFVGLGCAAAAARLADEELKAVMMVANILGKRDWIGLGDNPCSNQPPWWNITNGDNNTRSGVYCNCTTTPCHVTNIILKTMYLNGSLPPELGRLPFLQEIDLSRNYLGGSIPPEWGSMQSLRIISLLGNRLTGQIPKQLGNITTLEELVLEANQINGTIPSELGSLFNIKRLLFTSNNLTGELPTTLSQLTSLEEFRISGNNFTGSIPEYIQNWTNIKRIEIQGSGLTGPIPSNLSSLTKLIDLRISDLIGSRSSNFPNLSDSTDQWKKLILRSCNLVGPIPPFIAAMSINEDLDLSFNNLTGPIPPMLADRRELDNIYLTGNSLSGKVPEFKIDNVDLSYNNFTTDKNSEHQYCSDGNLFANSKGSTPGTLFCVKSSTCKPDAYHSFYINCGGSREGDYEADDQGSSNSLESDNWGFKNTGTFLNSGVFGKNLIESTVLDISGADLPQLYKNARLSPLSLTYYGFCLRNGNYSVALHFAEIMFTNDSTYGDLGVRIFDIYIQDILEKKDFNIASAAGGVLKAHTENFTANVSDHTLEIRFYWAGKGTTALPQRSVYGPLISAISVSHATYRPPPAGRDLSGGAIAGIVMGVVATTVLVLGILWRKGCIGRKYSMHNDLKGLDLRTGSFSLRQIKAATNNFDPANKIGEGGFGPVYKGVLLDGQVIAVKQLSSKSKQGNREFVNEIGMISALQHPHLVKLYGCCIEANQLLLVYEYCQNNSLARALFGPVAYQLHLDWATRHTISIGIARGLAYLHEESRLKIVHRDIKTTNVLLDENLVPKISDFGLAKLDEEDNTHISTRIAGTFGYMAPEYAMHGYLTDKADVYSFGVVLLEIVTGKSNSSIKPKEQNFYLIDWANSLKAKGSLLELVDPRLELKFNKEEVIRAINVALICTNAEAVERPSMSAVVSMLEGLQKLVSRSNISIDKTKPEEISRDGEGQSVSVDVPWSGSSASASDLYPVAPDTSYWEKRSI